MTHTPGPWATSRDAVPEGHVQTTVYAEHGGARVATAFECEANAHLIAAAPDLLTALAVLVDHANEKYPHFESERGQEDIAAAIAAINKAKGE